jgi:hypothetical protein
MSTEIIETNPAPLSSFELAQRQAKALSASDLVPQQYKGNVANTLVALRDCKSHRRLASYGYAKSAHHSRAP